MTTIDVSLHKKQMQVFQSPARFRVCAAGRRGGKSYLSAIELLIAGLQDVNEHGINIKNKEVWYIAPTFQQGKDIMWNLLKDLGKEVIESTIENTATIKLINGRTIKIKGSDRPDTLRGVGISFVVMDEYAFMKPEVWDLIIRPTLSDVRGRALFIGTPEGKNHFYELWLEAQEEDNEEWEAFHFCSLDNPILAPSEIETARRTMSHQAFRQEYEASFQAAGGGVFSEDAIVYADEPAERGLIYIAYDPAGYGTGEGMIKSNLKKLDEHAIVVAEVGPSGWFIHDVIHGRWDVREASLRLIKACQKWHPAGVGIEKGSLKNAIMPYLEDQMRRLRIYPPLQEITHGGKKKQERIMWALQGRLQHGRITLKRGQPWNKPLVNQLLDFPNPMVHDDLIDALAYIDQVATTMYNQDVIIDTFEPLDDITGF